MTNFKKISALFMATTFIIGAEAIAKHRKDDEANTKGISRLQKNVTRFEKEGNKLLTRLLQTQKRLEELEAKVTRKNFVIEVDDKTKRIVIKPKTVADAPKSEESKNEEAKAPAKSEMRLIKEEEAKPPVLVSKTEEPKKEEAKAPAKSKKEKRAAKKEQEKKAKAEKESKKKSSTKKAAEPKKADTKAPAKKKLTKEEKKAKKAEEKQKRAAKKEQEKKAKAEKKAEDRAKKKAKAEKESKKKSSTKKAAEPKKADTKAPAKKKLTKEEKKAKKAEEKEKRAAKKEQEKKAKAEKKSKKKSPSNKAAEPKKAKKEKSKQWKHVHVNVKLADIVDKLTPEHQNAFLDFWYEEGNTEEELYKTHEFSRKDVKKALTKLYKEKNASEEFKEDFVKAVYELYGVN